MMPLGAEPAGLRKWMSVAVSVGLHGSVLAWVAFAPIGEDGKSLYERDIRPNATRIVWYSLKQPLPAISPSAEQHEKRTPRALTRSPRTLVAGKQDLLRPPQLIWTPAPPVETPKMLPSPNIVALAPPQRPQPRDFVPPPEAQAKAPAVVLPAAPELTVALAKQTPPKNLLPPMAAARKTFIPPTEAVHQPASTPVNLPAAPAISEAALQRPILNTAMAKPLKEFIPPEEKPRPAPAAPILQAPDPAVAKRAPDTSLAIVGLFPTRAPELPTPKASQEAGFSAGPKPLSSGSDDAPEHSELVVPGLLARSGAGDSQPVLSASLDPPTSMRNLMAAARAANVSGAARPQFSGPEGAAVHVSEAPHARLAGRMVYSMSLQMPNVTSFSGSWVVWFAERESGLAAHVSQVPPGMTPPVPVRKVDPKYASAAVEDRIEGKVMLAAVIRRDGRVDTVDILRGLDTRLDQSAADALAKWEFEPATRNGVPIEVDAVFEIPFHLAPRAAR